MCISCVILNQTDTGFVINTMCPEPDTMLALYFRHVYVVTMSLWDGSFYFYFSFLRQGLTWVCNPNWPGIYSNSLVSSLLNVRVTGKSNHTRLQRTSISAILVCVCMWRGLHTKVHMWEEIKRQQLFLKQKTTFKSQFSPSTMSSRSWTQVSSSHSKTFLPAKPCHQP